MIEFYITHAINIERNNIKMALKKMNRFFNRMPIIMTDLEVL